MPGIPHPMTKTPEYAARREISRQMFPNDPLLEHHHWNLETGNFGMDRLTGQVQSILSTIVESDGMHLSIPTLWEGKELSPNEAFVRAMKRERETGQHYPRFPTRAHAELYDALLHEVF